MRYEDYEAFDFICDEFFLKWLQKPDVETELFWENWIKSHPHKVVEINKAKEFLENVRYEKNFKLNEKQFSGIHENIIRFSNKQTIIDQTRWQRRATTIWWSVAASALICAFSFIFFTSNNSLESNESSVELLTIATPKAAKKSLRLPDGTMVKLNGASKITYPEVFSSSKRLIQFEGEGFFEVMSDTSRPFIIQTGSFVTEVLGTSFNYAATLNGGSKKVAVVTGSVKVQAANNESVVLKPEQIAIYNAQTDRFEVDKFDLKDITGWKDGILYFNRKPLHAVFKDLEIWFDVEISISKDIAINDIYSGEYQNETLKNVLYGIGYTSGFQFTINGKQVKIFKNEMI